MVAEIDQYMKEVHNRPQRQTEVCILLSALLLGRCFGVSRLRLL